MDKCLKTQLMEIVNNDNLMRLGKFTLGVNFGENQYDIQIWAGDNAPEVIAGPGTTISAGINPHYKKVGGTGKIYISDKYNLTNVGLRGNETLDFYDLAGCAKLKEFVKYGSTTINNLRSINDLDVFNELTSIIIEGGDLFNEPEDDIINFTMPNLATLQINSTKIKGTMSKLGDYPLTKIKIIGNLQNPTFTGAIEDMIAIRKKNGATSGNISWDYPKAAGSITFNDEAVTAATTNVSLSWEASGNNTAITFNGSTVIISVAPNGSWTKVS